MATSQSQQQQQQQTGQQQLDAAFPAPPDYYQHFTDANLANPSDDAYLDPPPPLTSGDYSMFGRTYKVHEQLPTLSEQSATQLYPEGAIDRVVELRKLNHSVLFEFLEMVDILIKDPSQFGERSAGVHNIFVNMHHLINEYRGHQAMETLKVMVAGQIERRREAAERVRETCAELEEKIRGLKEEARKKGVELAAAGVEAEVGGVREERPERDVEMSGLRNLIDAISQIQ